MTDTDQQRPDPDQLLQQMQQEQQRSHAGRLKVFFGMAAGVGKTYAMLSSARRLAAGGADVLVGLIETHGRPETEALLQGLQRLPRRSVHHAGIVLHEFDLDAALRRHPEVLLLDELAHSNAPGSRHDKRWGDVQELLAAGIDVHTTLNVQHLDSVLDIVAQITGIQVRETVPDQVFDRADEVELVDLAPEELLNRLQQGRVYLPETAAVAMRAFFKPGNLTALRELALRRTAQWVDAELADYRRAAGVRAVWPAGERMLVCVGPSPHSANLVRAAHRMGSGLRAQLFAVFVQSRRRPLRARADRERVLQHLALAESLGARTQTLQGDDPAATLIRFARDHNVQRIVVGKTAESRLHEILFGSFTSELIRASGDIEVAVLRGDDDATRPQRGARDPAPPRRPFQARPWLEALGITALCAGLGWLAYRPPDLSAEAMLVISGVALTALRCGRGPAVLATVFGVLAFNFLFTQPRFTFEVDDPADLLTFAVMLAIGLIIGTLVERVRHEAAAARERQQETEALYALARALGGTQSEREVAVAAASHLADAVRGDAAILLALPRQPLSLASVVASSGATDWLTPHELGVAAYALLHNKPAGLGTMSLPGAAGFYLPIAAGTRRVGVLAMRPAVAAPPFTTRQRILLQTFAAQIGQSLQRLHLLAEGQEARIAASTERLRSSLLSSVSHDLRTPLASICSAAGNLLDPTTSGDADTRTELAAAILAEAERLNDLIANLVHATRLDNDEVKLKLEWTSIEEVLAHALQRVHSRMQPRPLQVTVPAGLPLLQADPVLLEQAFFNLLDNVARHTPAGTAVAVQAEATAGELHVRVCDDGPGPEARSASSAGLGLGLVVVEAIVKAHHGRVLVHPRLDQPGTEAHVTLPLPLRQPTMPEQP